jgi:pimeloyl-ACP methyl ester carboxylesterase
MMMAHRKIKSAMALFPIIIGFTINFSYSQVDTLNLACCRETELTYMNGEIQLAGVLLSPTETGEYPAAVILHGSGDSDRSNYWARLVAETFVSKGVAVLLTDKRGNGESAGDWRISSFEDLAKDGLAGIDALRQVRDIRKDRLGFIGLSQGGIFAPLAASMGDIQFVVNLVGSALPMKPTLFHELEQTYRQHGLGDADIAYLQRMTTLSFDYLETGEGFEDYLAHRDAVTKRYGAQATASWPSSADDSYWIFWGAIHDFDPMPYWRQVVDERGIPAFVGYGELDEADNIPVKAGTERFKNAISGEKLTIRVYEGTGHSLMDEELRRNGQFRLVDELIRDLDSWVEANIRR